MYVKKAGFVALLYFLLLFLTLGNYNVSWDEATHFKRGHAYLRILLTGETNYDGLLGKRSFYQNDVQDGEFWLKDRGGHPAANGVMAALLNTVFYQKLSWLGDVESHHLFNIVSTALLVGVVYLWMAEVYGDKIALISSLVVGFYPLMWSEAHFNVKDPPLAAFFTASLWAGWKVMRTRKDRWILAFFLFWGVALATKLNALFVPLILAPFLLIEKRRLGLRKSIIGGMMVILLVFVGTWPALWRDFPKGLGEVFSFYKQVGTGQRYQPDKFYLWGFNGYAPLWIILSTPLVSLVLFFAGVRRVWRRWRDDDYFGGVLVVWLLVVVGRVMLPGSSVYGGVRQIMEYVPALAMMAGVGFWELTRKSDWRLMIVVAVGVVLPIGQYYRNENLYFNELVGGLSGASAARLPAAGNSYGNAYLQGAEWVNRNVPLGARLTLLQGELSNLPRMFLRGDIDYQKEHFSGVTQDGEFIMELAYEGVANQFFYGWEYVRTFLEPVYEVKVDGVAILTIWKNDPAYTVLDGEVVEEKYEGKSEVEIVDRMVVVTFPRQINLSRIGFTMGKECLVGYVEVSLDGVSWTREKDNIMARQVGYKPNCVDGKLEYYFAGRGAGRVRFVFGGGEEIRAESFQISQVSI